MSISKRFKILGTLCVFFIFSEAYSQSSASNYTALGLGDFNYSGLTQNRGMGGLGISFGTGWGLNYLNPALTTRNTIFNFQAAFNYQRINVSTSTDSEIADGGGLSYVGMSFPINSGKSTLGLGINQITSVNYSLNVTGQVANTNQSSLNRIDGDGGVSEAYLSTGFLVAKNLSLGIHGSYLFGSTIRTNQLTLLTEEGTPIGVSSEFYQRRTVSDVAFKTGAQYYFKIGAKSNLHLGAIYQYYGNISGKEFAKVADFGQASNPDAEGDVISDNVKGSVYIPNNIGYGLTYEKINKFVIGLEAQHQKLSQVIEFNGSSTDLGDAFKVSFGGMIVPDLSAVDNLFKRITYRFGMEYYQTPYVVSNTQIDDIGINFGGSVPINSLSLVNFAVKFGRRGTTDNGLIRENYVNFSLGFSLNDNTWFYKRVFE
ncbi:hypothetical protein [Shivajiella indica]|uniref:Uncharacterized protein n=1 Tax=Shivajiella indica TaxID=872115 RepID=A0ABW5BER9_9BACT